MRTLNREDLVNILYGAAILGTGGGGSLTEASSSSTKRWLLARRSGWLLLTIWLPRT